MHFIAHDAMMLGKVQLTSASVRDEFAPFGKLFRGPSASPASVEQLKRVNITFLIVEYS